MRVLSFYIGCMYAGEDVRCINTHTHIAFYVPIFGITQLHVYMIYKHLSVYVESNDEYSKILHTYSNAKKIQLSLT